ncbi:MAG: OadG family protein [Candidatus Scalindua sp.]|nr:OadG family protein [Candidatus Scalindua sp.]
MEIKLSIQNILDGRGFDISITGMVVVFTALALISAFISLLPAILRIVNRIFPQEEASHAPSLSRSSHTPENEVIAAIGFALHMAKEKHVFND